MDTSANHHAITSKVLGTQQTPLVDITPEAWYEVLHDVFTDFRMKHAHDFLFQPIGRLTDGAPPYIPIPIPRGKIVFGLGLGVNTEVHMSHMITNCVEVERSIVYESNNLLLTKGTSWAFWTIYYTSLQGQPAKKNRFISSEAAFLDHKHLLRVFKMYPRCAEHFLHVGAQIMLHAENLRNRAHQLGMLSKRVQDIRERILR